MPTEWIAYWKTEQIQAAIAEGNLNHAASDQFGSITPGDSIWICGSNEKGDLLTIGALEVADVVSQRESERRFNVPLWRARFHVLAADGTQSPPRKVLLTPV